MDRQEIQKWLPHRQPFLFVDRITQIVPGERIEGEMTFQPSEPFYQGHFPGTPVTPGVLMIEALAQLSCILGFKTAGGSADKPVYFLGINEARFRRVVKPGEKLTMTSMVLKQRRGIWVFKAQAKVGEEVAVDAEIMASMGGNP